MGRRLPAALCGGRAPATRVMRRKRVQRASSYSSASSPSKLPAAALTSGGNKAAGSAAASSGGGGGCYVNGNGELMVEVGIRAAGTTTTGSKKDGGGGRRVMVLADGRAEAAGALQWALSQAVRRNDTVVLLAVAKPPPARDVVSDSCVKMLGTKTQRHLAALRTLCESTRPEVMVETCAVEAEERAPAVVDAARRHGASLLVLGQRPRRHAVARWLLQALWRRRSRGSSSSSSSGGGGGGGGTVEYCIENAPCVALAVRRRSSGGYLVSSKHHRDFWLLA